jgi:predicted O-methyltransferase YrrM
MREAGVEHPYVGIDTFNGFLPQDIKAEYARGKQYGTFDDAFRTTKQVWYDFSLAHAGYNVRSYKADASTFDYSAVAPIGFALIDVDLYRPVLLALRAAWPHVQPGGVIVVDDCDPTHKMWDGAHQAYLEFCSEHAITPQILDGKLGIIHH